MNRRRKVQGFHGGKVELERPRIRARNGKEMPLPSWEEAVSNDLLGKWAMNLMLINVSTRKYGRAVRLPEGGIGAPSGSGVSKSAVSLRVIIEGGHDFHPRRPPVFIEGGHPFSCKWPPQKAASMA